MALRTVLIDADILAYQISSSVEKVLDFNGQHVLHADLNDGIREAKNALEYITDLTSSSGFALMFTGTNNFRKQVLPSYKANRVGRKPMILGALREWMQDNHRSFIEDNLEGDDLLGIHATMPHKGERVIYSIDKDLVQIPALHWDPTILDIVEVTSTEGDAFFYQQVLTGDVVDNYSGCPGVGPVTAKAFLEEPYRWVKTEGKWKKEPTDDVWAGIVSIYQKAGMSPADALQQARCARILRHGDYDFTTKEVSLWNSN